MPLPVPPPFATGLGYDVHRFAAGRPLVLGGVEIPHEAGLDGHSDADVLLHALCDALLGSVGLPDIGHFFPNTEERWRGADSRELLRLVVAELHGRGWYVGNGDLAVIAEVPKLAPYLDQMKQRIAEDLQITPDRIGIKATTNERMGFVGRKEGIAALATVLVFRPR